MEVDSSTVALRLEQCQCYYFCEVDKGKIHRKHDSGMIVRIIVRRIRSQDEERYGKIEIDRSGMVDKGG